MRAVCFVLVNAPSVLHIFTSNEDLIVTANRGYRRSSWNSLRLNHRLISADNVLNYAQIALGSPCLVGIV